MNNQLGNLFPIGNETDLSSLFAPRSVALVGATDHPNNFASRVFRGMRNFGYKGKIYPVNPRLKEIHGLACYPGIMDLPETPDHVGIVVPAKHVMGILEDCAERGVKFATVCTSGYAETATIEGCERQAQLISFARSSGMRIMGPNCNGVINFVDRFAMTSSDTIAGPACQPGNVGVVSHSGGLGHVTVMWRAQMSGLGMSYVATCGNEADLDTLDFAQFMLRSESTDIVLMAIEGFKDGAKLKALAIEALELEKPIVVLKLGRTEAGGRVAASHTGAIVGVNDIYEAAFKQYGLISVNTCNELFETAILLRNRRWPKGRCVASAATTGGNLVNLADMGADQGILWKEYSDETQIRLGSLMPGYGSKVLNPTDLTSLATGEPEIFTHALNIIANDPNIDAIAPIFLFGSRLEMQSRVDFIKNCPKPAAMIWLGACSDDPTYTPELLVASGVPVYRDSQSCLRSMRAAMDFGKSVARQKVSLDITKRPSGIETENVRIKLNELKGIIAEHDAKIILAEYGFPVTREILARNSEEAVTNALLIKNSVALKINSSDIPHKTEAGAIRLNLIGDDSVRNAYKEIIDAALSYAPMANIDGILVQEMVSQGIEMMLGIIIDPVFGPVVVCGFGGVYVEVLHDVSHRVAPVSYIDALEMVKELRGYKLLEGLRASPQRDIECLCDLIVRLSWFAHDFKDSLTEVDINPVILMQRGEGARVVDALIVCSGA